MRNLMVCPMLHLPDVSKSADILLIFINGGPGIGMSSLQSASKEIREAFKAGECVVFGAHVDENMGEEVRVIVLGATNMEADKKIADVAPVSHEIHQITKETREAHPTRLGQKAKVSKSRNPKLKTKKTKVYQSVEQNTFSFMDDKNQRGIFDDLPNRNIYEGEDLDVPTYLRRGVQVVL